MEITIIYGSERKGSTYNCVNIVKDTILKQENVVFNEIWLPKELPEFCRGCFSCFSKGEDKCPHYDKVKPIVDKLISADGIILASPVYGLNLTAAMKNLIDHLCYMWIVHRPSPLMFSKIGFVLSTTAGAGTKHANKTMERATSFLGIKRCFRYGIAVEAINWDEIKPKKRIKMDKELTRKALSFYRSILRRDKLSYRPFTRFFFLFMKSMIRGYEEGQADKEYWKNKGWLDKKSPFI